jgi:hypothetical protein
MSLSTLCKVCFHYNPVDKTCGRSVVAVNKTEVHHDYAKSVRLDKNRCGPKGKWFVGFSEKSSIDELFDSFDI